MMLGPIMYPKMYIGLAHTNFKKIIWVDRGDSIFSISYRLFASELWLASYEPKKFSTIFNWICKTENSYCDKATTATKTTTTTTNTSTFVNSLELSEVCSLKCCKTVDPNSLIFSDHNDLFIVLGELEASNYRANIAQVIPPRLVPPVQKLFLVLIPVGKFSSKFSVGKFGKKNQ